MRSIAIMNQKGGVGKTTTSVNLSAALAMSGKRVLLIDMDPQAHATLHLGVNTESGEKNTIYDVLVDDVSLASAKTVINDNFHLVGSDLDLAAAEMELSGVVGRELILRDKLKEDGESYDYLIIDCPPSLGVLTLNALVAVEEAFIPMQPHFLALHGLTKLLQTIQLINKRLNSKLRVSGVIMCMYDGSARLTSEVTGDVEEFFQVQHGGNTPWANARIFNTHIRKNVRLAEAPSFGTDIFTYDPKCPGALDYLALADEVIQLEEPTEQGN